jgi:prophage tail gpP-like protein
MADQPIITIQTGGKVWTGWLQSEVTRSIEAISGTFSVPVSLTPGMVPPIKRQDEVRVAIGGHVLIDGYVTRAAPFYRKGDVGMMVVGRDFTGDFIRSSAMHKGGQWRKAKLSQIVRDLAEPFDIDVNVVGDEGEAISDFKLCFGESCLDAVSRACKLRGLLPVPDGAGGLLLTKAGTLRAPGEIRRGKNVISMEDIGSDEHRHSEYIVYGQTTVAEDFDDAKQVKAHAYDGEVPRYSPLIIGPDGNNTKTELQALVDHTARVRRGHAYGYRYEVEGWLINGRPWPINARVPVFDDVAGLYGEELLICTATQTCSLENGSVTVLEVRPIEAYDTVPLKTKAKHRRADRSRGKDGATLEAGKR